MLTASFMKSISLALEYRHALHMYIHIFVYANNNKCACTYRVKTIYVFPCKPCSHALSLSLPEYSLIAHRNKMQLLFISYSDGVLFAYCTLLPLNLWQRPGNILSTWSSNISICENLFSIAKCNTKKSVNGIHLLAHCGMHLHRTHLCLATKKKFHINFPMHRHAQCIHWPYIIRKTANFNQKRKQQQRQRRQQW